MRLIFLDLETSGLNPFYHEIMEIGMVIRTDHDIEYSATFPFSFKNADPEALNVNQYHRRVRQGEWSSPTPRGDLADHILKVTDGAILVGNNIQFDVAFLRYFLWMNRPTVTPTWYYASVDLKALLMGYTGVTPPASLSAIATSLGVPEPRPKHTALGDARWNRDVWDAYVRKCEST